MSRSCYKLPYVHKSLIEHNIIRREKLKTNIKMVDKLLVKKVKIKSSLFFWKRNSNVNLNLIDKKIAIHNGLTFNPVIINYNSIGYKLGAFSVSRRLPKHGGKQKQKPKQKQIKKQNKKK